MPLRLSPIIDPAPDAILAGDPRRAFALAQAVTVQPEMSHLARGLWGYTGETGDGRRLTVQSTGIGGPAAATVVAGLAGLGVRRVVRLGTCVATGPMPATGKSAGTGEAFLVTQAVAGDGASAAITGGAEAGPDPALTAALGSVAPPGRVFSHDLPPHLAPGPYDADPAPLRDLQTAATFSIAAKFGISAAAILVVAETAAGERLTEPELEEVFVPLARSVTAALGGRTDGPQAKP